MIGLAKERSLAISNEDKGMLEAKADAFGLFYGFLAGYDTYRVMPKTLEAIYKGYKIPDQQEGYPDKSERLRFSEEKIREISPLRFIFWAGQLLLLRKEFEAAVSCFDYILSQYPSPEIYNNTGLARLARAMELMDTQEIYFAYPFELDANTRLKRGTLRTNVKPKESELTVNLLSDAQAAFEKALDMDNGYSPAYINLACTYSLQGNQAAAVGKINELEVLNGSTRLPGNAHLIRGIALVKDGQVGKANTDFDKVKQKKAFQHTYNLELYKQISASWEDKTIHWLTHWPTAENWIKSFWNQSKESKSTPPDGKWETIPFSKIELTEKPEVSVVIPGPQFPVKVSGKTNAEGYSLQLDLPDYRLDVIYSRSILSMSDVQETKIGTSISSSQIRSTNPSYSISGTGGIRYDYYQNEGVVFEMENEIRRGWWKYLISY
jgi:tetratricopeptide (TPR) repeat protein